MGILRGKKDTCRENEVEKGSLYKRTSFSVLEMGYIYRSFYFLIYTHLNINLKIHTHTHHFSRDLPKTAQSKNITIKV